MCIQCGSLPVVVVLYSWPPCVSCLACFSPNFSKKNEKPVQTALPGVRGSCLLRYFVHDKTICLQHLLHRVLPSRRSRRWAAAIKVLTLVRINFLGEPEILSSVCTHPYCCSMLYTAAVIIRTRIRMYVCRMYDVRYAHRQTPLQFRTACCKCMLYAGLLLYVFPGRPVVIVLLDEGRVPQKNLSSGGLVSQVNDSEQEQQFCSSVVCVLCVSVFCLFYEYY